MNKTMMKNGFRFMGAIVSIALGGKLIYDMGCQQGVSVSEWLVEKYEPEAYRRLCEMVNK